jgi:hypothetical protein
MPIHIAGVSEKRKLIALIQDGGQIKREKDIYYLGPRPIPIICHLPDPPSFALPTTFERSKTSPCCAMCLSYPNLRIIMVRHGVGVEWQKLMLIYCTELNLVTWLLGFVCCPNV